MRILVVEDEPKMAALIRRVLVAERHVVDVAPRRRMAIALAERGHYDVIVLDRMLPGMDGSPCCACSARKGTTTPV